MYQLRNGKVTRYSQNEGVPLRGILRPFCDNDQGGVWFAADEGVVRFKNGSFTVYGNHGELAGLTVTCL